MPELPEVETIRRDLDAYIRDMPITDVLVRLPRLVRGDVEHFSQQLRGGSFQTINRIGKLLILTLAPDRHLLIHLKMTGQLIFQHQEKNIVGGHSYGSDVHTYPNAYTYITFTFADGSKLYFNDMRTFGYMEIVDATRLAEIKNRFGIEPLQHDFTYDAFVAALGRRTTTIKAALLNQQLFAGIGNIYADEICFAAKVLPDRRVHTLREAEKKALYTAAEKIIKKAIDARGTTFNNYVDSQGNTGSFTTQLKVFGRTGKQCLRCKKGIIVKTKVAGRGTHFCPECQQ